MFHNPRPSADLAEFWRERHIATLTTPRADGTPHVVPVGVTVDEEFAVARVICSGDSVKARNVGRGGAEGTPVAVSQVEGRRWSTLEGRAVVRDDADSVAEAERRYAERYRTPRVNPRRVVLEITLTRRLGMR